MIQPRAWLAKRRGETACRIEAALLACYRPTMPKVMGIFERMSPRRRRLAGRRAVGARMAVKFAAGVKVGLSIED